MERDSVSFLGKGWSFPPTFDLLRNQVVMVSDIEDVMESIRIILNTTPGERIMQPTFGCHIKRLVFENFDSNIESELNHIVSQALLDFEPRINFTQLIITRRDHEQGILYLDLHFTLVATNTRHNIVYPFYEREGTNIARENSQVSIKDPN